MQIMQIRDQQSEDISTLALLNSRQQHTVQEAITA